VSLVIHAQRTGEPVAWLEPFDGALYPPDLADSGVDLDALVVVRVPRQSSPHETSAGLARAGELLLRSGAFGLVIVDLSAGVPRGDGWQSRLAALAREHAATVVLLTSSSDDAPSIGPLVGLRVASRRDRRAPGTFVVEHRVLKDKLGAGAAPAPDRRRGPWGAA
jgi:recombination protein RecA